MTQDVAAAFLQDVRQGATEVDCPGGPWSAGGGKAGHRLRPLGREPRLVMHTVEAGIGEGCRLALSELVRHSARQLLSHAV